MRFSTKRGTLQGKRHRGLGAWWLWIRHLVPLVVGVGLVSPVDAQERYPDPAAEMWMVVRDSEDPSELQTFVDAFPDSPYAHAARARLKRMGGILDKPQFPVGSSFRERLRSGGAGPEMVVVPAGQFQMGCVSDQDCYPDEKPVHEVTIGSFALSKFEVTFEEYDRFTAATGREKINDNGWKRGQFPAINVSWQDAVAYTEWLSLETGNNYRLPSESEWEYAARSGSITKYHFGDDVTQLCRYANHADKGTEFDHRNKTCSDSARDTTANVGLYQPNAFGLYDMHGNVWEWVQDCWNEGYQGVPTDSTAWTEGTCDRRVSRGGAWNSSPRQLRSAYRGRSKADARVTVMGFRVVRKLTR